MAAACEKPSSCCHRENHFLFLRLATNWPVWILPTKYAISSNVQLRFHTGSEGLLGCPCYTSLRKGCARCEPVHVNCLTFLIHSVFKAVSAPSKWCCRCIMADLKEMLLLTRHRQWTSCHLHMVRMGLWMCPKGWQSNHRMFWVGMDF